MNVNHEVNKLREEIKTVRQWQLQVMEEKQRKLEEKVGYEVKHKLCE